MQVVDIAADHAQARRGDLADRAREGAFWQHLPQSLNRSNIPAAEDVILLGKTCFPGACQTMVKSQKWLQWAILDINRYCKYSG
jgi:hypothetical protein